MLPSRQGGAEVECDWFTDRCVFLHYLLMRFVKPKSTCAFRKKNVRSAYFGQAVSVLSDFLLIDLS